MSVVILLRDDSKEINKLRALTEHVPTISKQDLPVPSFRKLSPADYRKKKLPNKRLTKQFDLTKTAYFHYDEPSPDKLMERLEYDMDDHDEAWLKKMNDKWRKDLGYELTEHDFEQLMDRLEKESYFESKSEGRKVIPEVDDDAVCAICLNGDSDNNTNQIIFCDMCDLPVHQECYGVPYIPEGQWICRRCLQSPSSGVDCVLCPNKGGAFKQTEDGRWAHVICALWIPEVSFANTVFLEPIDNIDRIPQARWKLTCYICKQKRAGACIQCRKNNCYVPFHVTCAQQAGLYMRIKTHRFTNESGPYMDVLKEAFCDAHAPKNKSKKSKGMYSDDEDTETEEMDEVKISKNYYKKMTGNKRDSISKTRRILAEKRASDPNPICEPSVKEEKLKEIAKLISLRGKKWKPDQQTDLRTEILNNVQGYWIMKRKARKGVPLLRRLQVSFGGNIKTAKAQFDVDKYTRLRYDLERARLLVGEVKKRELLKKRIQRLNKDIVAARYKIIDMKKPATED